MVSKIAIFVLVAVLVTISSADSHRDEIQALVQKAIADAKAKLGNVPGLEDLEKNAAKLVDDAIDRLKGKYDVEAVTAEVKAALGGIHGMKPVDAGFQLLEFVQKLPEILAAHKV